MNSAESPFGPAYIFAGGISDEEQNFHFQVWSQRRLTAEEVDRVYATWRRSLTKTTRIRGKTIRVQYNSANP